MARYYRKTRRYARRSRPSERKIRAGEVSLGLAGTTYTGYVYEADVPQTVRSIRLDTGKVSFQNEVDDQAIVYALVVVREGYNTNNLNYPAVNDDMYNPTQDVLISGVLTGNSVEDHKFNTIGRKLKAGDRLALLYRSVAETEKASFELSFTALY